MLTKYAGEELDVTTAGERLNGDGPWETDLYGTAEKLSKKRELRGWKDKTSEELGKDLEPVVQRLLKFCGGVDVFPEKLPWE